MQQEVQFKVCSKCGNLAEQLYNAGVDLHCCGMPMQAVVVNPETGAMGTHKPAVKVDGQTVLAAVGENPHPMSEEHSITWVMLQTNRGIHRQALAAEEKPAVDFALSSGETPMAVYSYCNLHGLWRTDVEY